jgi:hypothetical protein
MKVSTFFGIFNDDEPVPFTGVLLADMPRAIIVIFGGDLFEALVSREVC